MIMEQQIRIKPKEALVDRIINKFYSDNNHLEIQNLLKEVLLNRRTTKELKEYFKKD